MNKFIFLVLFLILGLSTGLKISDEYGFLDLVSEQELQRKHVQSTSYIVEQDFLDSQFQGIISASDGKTYFALASHTTEHNGQFYSFDPKSETVTHIKDLGAWCGEDSLVGIANTQGKIHSNIYEVDGKLYMSTTSGDFVEDFPYRGGHFIAYDLYTGECIDLGRYPDVGENGLLTMMYEPVYKRLYAIHQRNETLIYYDLRSENIVTIGSIQDSRQPRDLISDKKGRVYGTSNPCGLIWCYDPATNKRHALITTIPADPDGANCNNVFGSQIIVDQCFIPLMDGIETFIHWLIHHREQTVFSHIWITTKIDTLPRVKVVGDKMATAIRKVFHKIPGGGTHVELSIDFVDV
jgi:hypothetical protein